MDRILPIVFANS